MPSIWVTKSMDKRHNFWRYINGIKRKLINQELLAKKDDDYDFDEFGDSNEKEELLLIVT